MKEEDRVLEMDKDDIKEGHDVDVTSACFSWSLCQWMRNLSNKWCCEGMQENMDNQSGILLPLTICYSWMHVSQKVLVKLREW